MRWFSWVAVYMLFWVLSGFAVLSFGIRSHDDDESVERVPGQATSAPINFRPGKVALRATLLSAALFVLFYLNLRYGWVNAHVVESIVPVPASLQSLTIYQ